jgi:site-specific DNA-cytosine methylase
MKVAVLCEFSGRVRHAFEENGYDAVSFDLLDTEIPGKHIIGDITKLGPGYFKKFDLVVAHPPCTDLAVSGARWFKYKQKEQREALDFVHWIMNLPVKHMAIENPVSIISSKIRKPDQIIQPWQFGHGETKKTCLWLKNLPPLTPTDIVGGEINVSTDLVRAKTDGKNGAVLILELLKRWQTSGANMFWRQINED